MRDSISQPRPLACTSCQIPSLRHRSVCTSKLLHSGFPCGLMSSVSSAAAAAMAQSINAVVTSAPNSTKSFALVAVSPSGKTSRNVATRELRAISPGRNHPGSPNESFVYRDVHQSWLAVRNYECSVVSLHPKLQVCEEHGSAGIWGVPRIH